MMKSRILWLALCVQIFLCTSCKQDIFYEEIFAVDEQAWSADSLLTCEFEITDTLQFYTIYMDIRNTVDFETQNLYVFMDSEDPAGECNRDTLEFLLADAYGNWKGHGNGRYRDYQYMFYPKVRFPRSGKYKFTFQQAMRDETIQGIANFGMTIYLFDEKRFVNSN